MPNTITVADLMSRGVQTVAADATLASIIRRLRLIGHEGYPVVEDGHVIGLLTRRDADRALEHDLGALRVRDVMAAGAITLRPTDSVALLERRIVESGWGQIPVVDEHDQLIGIVTRTDLIKHWAQIHPDQSQNEAVHIGDAQIAAVLGQPMVDLIGRVARQAQAQVINLYMVGGVVRDLLLKRGNDDIDFVVEGDAIRFAEGLQATYGGRVSHYRPFGTATWKLEQVSFLVDGLPDHVDFASARYEFYEQPTALPSVYDSSIKLDLRRRDFTINALAVQLSPADVSGRVLDFYGGLADLRAGLIRVLHSLSFVDDPTRILRAVRFERRLGFQIEPRTAQLIETALPMLRRITGERIRNELTLLLGEADSAGSFLLLQERGILKAIHPAFVVPSDLADRFERSNGSFWFTPDPVDLKWCLLLADIPPDDLAALSTRLLFSKALSEAVSGTARLVQNLDGLSQPDLKPSRIVEKLDEINDLTLLAAWIVVENLYTRQRIWQYANEWRSVRPTATGHTLRARGLKPGPCFAIILSRLRAARLDGDVHSDAEEDRLLETLVQGGICDDGAE
ncbi:MAG TPA: CBS domain-containing protein [Phototrophicaceae bacterium]|nr:CBS domain-containing protein [Phototrophicaceae bacterium]